MKLKKRADINPLFFYDVILKFGNQRNGIVN